MTTRLRPLFTWRSAIVESDLTPSERLIALVLSLHMSERGDSCWPSLRTVADEAAMSYDGARRIVRRLVALGWLGRELQRLGGRRGTRTMYSAQLPPDLSTYEQGSAIPVHDLHRDPGSDCTGILDLIAPGSAIPASIGNSSRTRQELPAASAPLAGHGTFPTGTAPPWVAAGISRQQWLEGLGETA